MRIASVRDASAELLAELAAIAAAIADGTLGVGGEAAGHPPRIDLLHDTRR